MPPEKEDILADYREWRSQQEDRIGSHSDDCHMWPRHERCMIHRLAVEVERLRKEQRWIPVSDQMPTEGVRCIIATRIPGRYVIDGEPKDGHEIEFGEWLGNRWKCCSEFPCPSIMHPFMVSHWMPMPSLPEAKK